MAEASEKSSSSFGELLRTLVYAVLIAVFVRTFLYEPFSIPSGSMVPTLLEGDYLFVSKFTYGYSRHSFPFSLGLFGGRIFEGQPERGDIAVFKKPTDNETDFIKRIVGLPGDTLQVRGGVLYINGDEVPREPIGDYVDPDTGRKVETVDSKGVTNAVKMYRETLPNGVSYTVLDEGDGLYLDDTLVYVVPPGHYFGMGDNRDNSSDSRVLAQVGYIPAENLVGRAEVLFFSMEYPGSWWRAWRFPALIRYDRLFSGLR